MLTTEYESTLHIQLSLTIPRAHELGEWTLQRDTTEQSPIDGEEKQHMPVYFILGGVHHEPGPGVAARRVRRMRWNNRRVTESPLS
jgi:hypothetical protein